MQRLIELLLGLDAGFLSRQGDFSVRFNPGWPGQAVVGATSWNFALTLLVILLVVYVYRREGRTRRLRIALGVLRGSLLLFILALLNRPVLTLSQDRIEPSVVAILIDDSISMRIGDVGDESAAQSRLDAALALLDDSGAKLLHSLSSQHVVRLYRFSRHADPIAVIPRRTEDSDAPAEPIHLEAITPSGQNTQVFASLEEVLRDLQGQRLAGVIVLTDGRETPSQTSAEPLARLQRFGVKVFPVPVGSDRAPRNIAIESVSLPDSAFKGDIITARVQLRVSGFEPGHEITVVIKDKKTGAILSAPDMPGEVVAIVPESGVVEAELQLKPEQVGTLDLNIEAIAQPGELDEADNLRTEQLSVLDAKIAVLYVEGYPRWDYRYLKNELLRDKSVDVSCLLTSADATFAQEGDIPIRRFPETIEELLAYDVVLFGDVDPRQFTDFQLQLVNEFVSRRGGGFGMVAGPEWSPLSYRGTPIESILPVNIARVEPDIKANITQAFRPIVTTVGLSSGIFRFFGEKSQNERYLRESWPGIFWYCQGATIKPGVGEVYAEHPTEIGPDGRKAPLLAFGRFGAGRTMFSAIDDSWRWRYYTGESIFDTYWVQQLRYLARSKKIGQKRVTFATARPVYELGEQVKLTLRIIDPTLIPQLSEQLRVEILEEGVMPGTQPSSLPATPGSLVRTETLVRQEIQGDLYDVSFTADKVGRFVARLRGLAPGIDDVEIPLTVATPRLELATPAVDRALLGRLAAETNGQSIRLEDAAQRLPTLLPSVTRIIPVESGQPLWDAPLGLAIFLLLATAEWVLRKLGGML